MCLQRFQHPQDKCQALAGRVLCHELQLLLELGLSCRQHPTVLLQLADQEGCLPSVLDTCHFDALLRDAVSGPCNRQACRQAQQRSVKLRERLTKQSQQQHF
jgi:hypothetical protein